MPNSLTTMIKKLRYQGKINGAECEELLKKLQGHNREYFSQLAKYTRCIDELEIEYRAYNTGNDYWRGIRYALDVIEKGVSE